MKRLILMYACLLCLLIIPALNPVPFVAQAEDRSSINFPDLVLEQAIRNATGKNEGVIYKGDLTGLVELRIEANEVDHKKNINSLAGLEYCTSLKFLDVSGHEIKDISPLASLANLEELRIQSNHIQDISVLSRLSSLKILYLGPNSLCSCGNANKIRDYSPIRGLVNLIELDLSGCKIDDLELISGMKDLEKLRLMESGITNIDVLKGLKKLKEFELNLNWIKDLSPLADLKNLEVLELAYSFSPGDLYHIAGLTRMKRLVIAGDERVDLVVISEMKDLEVLIASNKEVLNLQVISGLKCPASVGNGERLR